MTHAGETEIAVVDPDKQTIGTVTLERVLASMVDGVEMKTALRGTG